MAKLKAVENKIPTEAEDQIKFVVWLAKQGIRVAASANGGYRNYLEAVKFKRMGVSKGFPDLTIPLPVAPYHGLYIEFKRVSGGIVSPEQQDWIDYLQKVGYKAEIAYGLEHAKQITLDYLALTPRAA